ncbi:protein disulfide isomerase [Anaeramoeba ignava]|uniref:protein disulfide-isomerase n=1 Tax=Anaeramoeba ignava TaxID=1746090 RepID=A0A9Q0LVY2_ANAIG|nr:protein disulfide isomerase [Anaeramoeba ignava]
MNFFFSFLIILTLLSLLQSKVTVLDKGNFKEIIEDRAVTLVKFYAPWCTHCKALAPIFEEASDKIEELGLDALFADVDATAETELAQEYEIRGYPTVIAFKKGVMYENYPGARTVEALISYVQALLLPPIFKIEELEKAKQFSKQFPISLIVFNENDDDEYFAELETMVEKKEFKKMKCAYIQDKEIAKEMGLEKLPGAILYRNLDSHTEKFEGDAIKDLKKFALENQLPLFEELSAQNYQEYMSSSTPLILNFIDPETKEQSLDLVAKIAAEFKSKLLFVWIDGKQMRQYANNFAIQSFPAMVIFDKIKEKRYYKLDPSEEEINEESYRTFLQNFLDKKLSYAVKSEPIPEKNDGPVKTVVYKNWDEIVLDKSKDVMLKIYADYCGHCKKMAPAYLELGEKLAEVETLTIAEIEGAKNDVGDNVDLQGFPTVLMFPADNKENPIVYSGDRSFEDMLKFVQENVHFKFELKGEKKEL